jgi:hypothetical protein
VPPPGPTVPVPPPELVEVLVELLVEELVDELLDPPQVLGLGGGWHLFVWELHHQPPQQPLGWQVCEPQPVHPAATGGPSRTPQTFGLPLELVLDELVPTPLLLVELVPDEPHALMIGTHTLAGLPSTVETGVQACPAAQVCPLVQSAAQ